MRCFRLFRSSGLCVYFELSSLYNTLQEMTKTKSMTGLLEDVNTDVFTPFLQPECSL